MKSEATHKVVGGSKMTALQSPVGLRSMLSSLVAFFIVVSSVSLLFDRGQESQVEHEHHREIQAKVAAEHLGSVRDVGEECNWSSGRWVYDNVSRPLYSGLKCPFIFTEVACDKYGRNDTMYQHWRWQPHGCDLPRFNATKLLEKLRNKRLVFVGDSLNRNQWVSLVCMVEASIPDGLKMRVFNGSLISFKALEYNATIDFYWSPLLLESNSDNPIIHRVEYRIVRAEKIEKHARVWNDADIIVFNSYLWWRKQKAGMRMKVMYGSFEDGDARLDEVEMVDGFEIALRKLTEWLGTNINKNKTRIFFAGSSPTHTWASDWGGDDSNKCLNETEPIQKEGYKGATTDYSMMDKAKQIFGTLEQKGIHVQILNITQLSDYRIDAHPTVFRRQFVPLTKEQIANPSSYADCTHWCLPGIVCSKRPEEWGPSEEVCSVISLPTYWRRRLLHRRLEGADSQAKKKRRRRMPCLNVSTNVNLDGVDTSTVLADASKTVATIIGKPEAYVMVVLKGSVPMAFGGTQEPAAYGELVSIGGLNPDVNKKLSAGVASILESKLSIPKSRFYLKFYDSKRSDFGWNGSTF